MYFRDASRRTDRHIAICDRSDKVRTAVWSDCADKHPLADFVARDTSAEFVNHAHRLVPDSDPRLNWVLSTNDVDVSTADRREPNFHDVEVEGLTVSSY